ncbi:MAG: glycosyltransferase family 4 protein [Anaerolineae bacterium]|nr:glycosyltransferase family 4 protein [Anaerolineae bacterium]
MRILQILTYYRPHISGLTIYVERLARGLAKAGHQVTVLTSQFDPSLPLAETQDGVVIVRAPVSFRLSKGVIMPTFGFMARWLMRGHDVLHFHLPQFDGAGLALNARWQGKPSLLTYHCDLELPSGGFNRVVEPVVHGANHVAARMVDRVVAYTDDYAKHSPFLSRYMHKLRVIPPPVEIATPSEADLQAFAAKFQLQVAGGKGQGANGDDLQPATCNLQPAPIIGMAARLATEKGVEVLVDALEIVRQTYPAARVLFAGPYQNVLGEEAYAARLQPRFAALGQHWTFTGSLKGAELAAFFASCDMTVLPSLNSTESFGLVQVESMLCGTPSICSNLPGVRTSVQRTGMGQVVPIGDAPALAAAIMQVFANRSAYVRPRHEIEQAYSTAQSVRGYERVYAEIVK